MNESAMARLRFVQHHSLYVWHADYIHKSSARMLKIKTKKLFQSISNRPRQIGFQIAQRLCQRQAMLLGKRLRILHQADKRTNVVSADGQRHHLPIVLEIDSFVLPNALH